MLKKASNPKVAIFDSGIGGISLLLALQKKAPWLDVLYLADTLHFPYGGKSPEEIFTYSNQICRFLHSRGANFILCGCNTASSSSFSTLQQSIPIPLLGVIDPAVKLLSELSVSRIGIVATETTVRLGKHQERLSALCPHLNIYSQACPKLAPLVEEGLQQKEHIASSIKEYLAPLLKANIEALLLGCTHYSFLHDDFKAHLPHTCVTIDPSDACIDALFHAHPHLALPSSSRPPVSFFTTSSSAPFSQTIKKLLNLSIEKSIEKVTL